MQSKEKLLTDLRKVLNITNDDHFKFLEEVMEDKQIARIRDAERELASRPADVYDRYSLLTQVSACCVAHT